MHYDIEPEQANELLDRAASLIKDCGAALKTAGLYTLVDRCVQFKDMYSEAVGK